MNAQGINRKYLTPIAKMLWETCGEDFDLVTDARVVALADNDFHITYKEDDPFDGLDLKVTITEIENGFHFAVRESVYADAGEFDIEM